MTLAKRAVLSLAALVAVIAVAAANDSSARFDLIRVMSGGNGDEVEHRYVELLVQRLNELTSATIISQRGSAALGTDRLEMNGPELTIHLGTRESYPDLALLADRLGVAMPDEFDPGREGFVLASQATGASLTVLAIGTDRRGVLYAVGEILRRAEGRGARSNSRLTYNCGKAPRWPVRGLIVVQGHTMRDLTGAREWTLDEWKRAHLDYALGGANTFDIPPGDAWKPIYDLVRQYGLRAHAIINGNAGHGPAEWQAKESIGRTGYLSPAIPEARAALLKSRAATFGSMPPYDSVHIKSGDGGGDESEAAAPYGRAFIHLCEDYAGLLHAHHPSTQVYVGNQKLDNAGDRAILEYLQTHNADWCAGICYGPGSNAMGWTPGRRQDHRIDLFDYARAGALGGYLRYLLHQLPPEQEILLFTDLTHWVYSQYGLMDHEIIADRDYRTPPPWDDGMYRHRPSEAMAMVYDRRTFHARPRNYYQVFQETTEFTIGDVAYSEGHHDHANNWIYQRLFWNPHQSVEAVVHEYARAHFGSEAADLMTAAIFTLEENLQTPIAENDGIDRLVELVESAGRVMPAERRRRSYLWHEYLEKACLDKYIQLDVRRQRALVDSVSTQLAAALEGGDLAATLSALAETSLPAPSDEMEALKARAVAAGGESERIFGLRSEGLFNLVQDYVGFGWLQHEIVRAVMAENERDRRAFVERILHYDDPGHDGFYDNAGVPGEAPHLVYGWSYGDGEFNSSNRRSQRTMAFTTDEERGVAFRYTDLDPDAEYRVRLTLVRPRFLPRYAKFQPQTRQSIYADDFLLAENLELPEYRADSFEFDVPRAATADGELRLWMKKQAGVGEGLPSDVSIWRNTGGWGTLVSEVWLMKKPDVAAAAE